MSRQQSKAGRRTPAASGFGSKPGTPRGFAGFGSSPAGSDLSYVAEPPDLTSISDAQVVVSFKNILKKDAITKTKGLEDLLGYVKAHPYEQDGGPEESILEAWVNVYPRTSIDNSRRVRELAHSVQFELMRSARKRMERRVPKVVGAWLAGLYDRDRMVSRAANDGISAFLNSPEKVAMFWKKCQPQILEFATGAIRETQDSLSDERSSTPEDAEAKYFRVLGAALSLVLGLLQTLKDDDTAKFEESYHEFLVDDLVWKCINVGDASVRKHACQLLDKCLESRKSTLEEKMSRLKKVLISDGLKSSHVGSALSFLKVLTSFTESFPSVWIPSPGDKKAPVSRLGAFIEKGSQGSQGGFWEGFVALIRAIPSEVITLDLANSIAMSMRVGISSREEPRFQAAAAWTSYLRVARHFMGALSSESEQASFAAESLFPLVEHYIHPGPPGQSPTWTIPGPSASAVIEGCYALTTESAPEAVKLASMEKWQQLSAAFRSRITNSLPEVSSDYQKSQEAIADEGARWFTLIGQVQRAKRSSNAGHATRLDGPAAEIVSCCVDILSRRNLKPFGAAKTIRHVAELTTYIGSHPQITTTIFDFLLESGSEYMALVLESKSRLDLVACVHAFADKEASKYERLWETWTASLLQETDEPADPQLLGALVSHEKAGPLALTNDGIQDYLVKNFVQSMTSTDAESWNLLNQSLKYGALTSEARKTITKHLLDLPQDDDTTIAVKSIDALTMMAKQGGDVLSEDDDLHLALIAKLLSLAESSDATVSSKASGLQQLIGGGHAEGKRPTLAIIRNNLERVGPESLEVETLVRLAIQELQANPESLQNLLPNSLTWLDEVSGLTAAGVNPSLSITSSLVGAQFLARASSPPDSEPIARDRNGCSLSARLGLYMANLLEEQEQIDFKSVSDLPKQLLTDAVTMLFVTAQMASDQLTMMEAGGLFEEMSPDNLIAVDSLVSSTQRWVKCIVEESGGWGSRDDGETKATVCELLEVLLTRSRQTTLPVAFYCAKAAAQIIQELTERYGPPTKFGELLSSNLPPKENPSAIFSVIAILYGVGQVLDPPQSLNTLCNRLVSDAAGAKPTTEKALATLVMLTGCLSLYGEGEVPVQMNRLVFAVKNVTGWFEAEDAIDPFFAAESCRLLNRLLLEIPAVYGSHWDNTLEYCTRIWASAGDYPADIALSATHASVKLYAALEAMPEPNDDLEDALKNMAEVKALALIDLLKLPRESRSQPQRIVDSLLCRQVEKLPLRLVKDLSEVYGLLASESRDIQTAAFTLMHKALPALQEQLSVDVLLDKRNAHLPDELLSLLLDPPTLEKYADDVLSQFPPDVRGYLLTWHLIFDSYSTASLNVRNDYTDDLKSGSYVGPLLDFIFDVLGHSAAHPLNLEKEGLGEDQVRAYDVKLAAAEADERDMHWLMVHVYFLTLRYVPELFKAWFINCRSKQTRIAVEGWMARYFSPLIVADALEDVAAWAAGQQQEDDGGGDEGGDLMIKVSKAAREVVAGYEVDESIAAITIRVPASYPIEGIVVTGTSRVVVDERKWQSWVRTTQGVITFSNGSIIDGLMAFRRNIVGALKGQTECAICYAIIASDRKMPDKRCHTCRNLFHRACLYKWFQTSSQNTCPLCRNPIDYLGAGGRRG